MDELKLLTFVLGPLDTNVYLVYSKLTRKAFIVDAPSGIEKVFDYVKKERLDVLFVLITHGHFDHIGGIDSLDLHFYIHQKDLPLLKDANLNGSSFFDESVSINKTPIFYSSSLSFEGYDIDIIHTPGHSPGSVSLKIKNWLFTGDTIFYDSIGRTDIPLASYDKLLDSIHKKILPLPKDTIIYPGHGRHTDLERELEYNPFLNDL